MIVRYCCPISTCSWFTERVASGSASEFEADVLSWSATTWGSVTERINGISTIVQVIDAHLVTHFPVQWMTELRDERRRAESVTTERDRLRIVVEKLSFLADAVDPLATRKLPSRAEVEATRELLASVVGSDAS